MTTINDPLIDTIYDRRYRIERRIGAGGMANVYLAEDETLGRRVAIKILHQRYAEDSQFVERFLREASAAARLNHPNIVQVYDRGQAGGSYYIAMEYVDGMTLKDLVRRRGALTEQEVLAYGRQALHALRAAHRNGLVHRDVKPQNMMVDTDGRLKIADFGIARAAADADQGLTEAGSIVGTAQYLSPEQAQGQEVGAPSDLYSLGVVMFEMSTGRVPFDGDSPVNVALKHVKDPVTRPSTLNPAISVGVESIILKAMEKDASQRYATADEMLADLDRARDGATTSAMTRVTPITVAPIVTPPAPVRPQATRYDQVAVAPEPAWPEAPWEDEDPREVNRSIWRWLLPLLVVLLLGIAAAYILTSGNDNGDKGGATAPKGTAVPTVTGKTRAAAEAAITAAGFQVGAVTSDYDDTVKAGIVISQDPAAGEKLKAGDPVGFVVSKGLAPVPVPDVVGKTTDEAVQAFTDAGFPTPKITEAFDDTAKEGTVIEQTPAANKDAAPTLTPTLVVSKGKEASTVPNVVGTPVDRAKQQLRAAGFTNVSTEQANSSQPAGTVIQQDPGANSDLAPDGPITLTVASGSNEVPDVTGKTEADARALIEDKGFVAAVQTSDTEDQTQWGVVLESSPAAGQLAKVGNEVTITVGQQPGGGGGAQQQSRHGNGKGHDKRK